MFPLEILQDFVTVSLNERLRGVSYSNANEVWIGAMSHDSPSERRINAVAMQLARIIEVNDAEPPEEMIQEWMTTLTESSFSCSECRNILSLAASLCRNNATSKPSSHPYGRKCLSLWDQFSSFSERVMWYDIIAAEDDLQRLSLLQKVDHIDDILSDWNDARRLVRHGLSQDDGGAYLELHSKWFGHCQATVEYQNIRTDLCRNVLNGALYHCGTSTFLLNSDPISISNSKLEYLINLLKTWKSMWVNVITSGSYDEEDADAMVVKALILLRNLLFECDKPNTPQLALLPAHLLALVDPRADWCRCWLDETPVHRIRSVIARSNVLPEIISRCQNHGIMQTSSLVIDSDAATITLNDRGTISLQMLEKVLHRQSLAILCCLLLHLRVLMFPWDQVYSRCTPMPQSSLREDTDDHDKEENYVPQFPSPVPFAEHDILDLAKALLTAKDHSDLWLAELGSVAVECLSSGCTQDKSINSKLDEIIASSK